MNIDRALKRISISVLLVAGTVLVNPAAARDREHRAATRDDHASQHHLARFDRRRADEVPPPPAPQGDNRSEPRKQGKMTPEERRALRRQINEAGQDIYVPKR